MKRVAAAIVLGGAVSACTSLLGLTDVPDVSEGGADSADTMTDAQDDGTVASDGSGSSTSDGGGDSESSISDAGGDGTLSDGPAVNLILNPSCENGTSPWTTLGGTPLASSTTVVHAGDTASCWSYGRHDEETMGDPVSYDGPLQDITSVVVPGHQYSASAWVLWAPPLDAAPGSAYGPQTIKLTVRETCSQTPLYPYSQWAVDTPADTWVHVVMKPLIVVPEGCDPLDIQIYVEGPDLGLDLYVDEMTLLFVL